MSAKTSLASLVKSFTYAFSGILYCVKNERNMRIHLCMIALVSMFAYFYSVTQTQYIILLLCMGLVVSAEMVNTSIETLTNLESPSYHQLAKIAKDVAAGAVFIAAIISVIVGIIVFFDLQRLIKTLLLIATTPLYFGSFIIVILLSVLFILNGTKIFGESKTKIYHMKNYNEKK